MSYLFQVMDYFSLELMLFMKMTAESIFKVVGDTLEIERACRINLKYNETDCAQMDDGNHTEIQVNFGFIIIYS